MKYKNGFYVNVGDIAIKDNGDVVLVTSVSKNGFCGLSPGGKSLCFYSQQEAERFCLHNTSLLRDILSKLQNVGYKEWFDILPYKNRNMLLALIIGHSIRDKSGNQYVILGFTNDGKEVTLICEYDKRINISDKSIEYYIDGKGLYEYLYTRFQKVNADNIQEG